MKDYVKLIPVDKVERSAIEQFESNFKEDYNIRGAIMPDIHTGYTLPIGSVIDSVDNINPTYIGKDIGCGVTVYETSIKLSEIEKHKESIFKDMQKQIPAMTRSYTVAGDLRVKSGNFELICDDLKQVVDLEWIDRQFATIGGGNHFVEIGVDEHNSIYITVHSGSRGAGAAVADKYTRIAKEECGGVPHLKANGKPSKAEVTGSWPINVESPYFREYINLHDAAVEYAFYSRRIMAQITYDIICKHLGLKQLRLPKDMIIANENHNMLEEWNPGTKKTFYRHRKGAAPLYCWSLTPILANMADGVFLVRGKYSNRDLIRKALYSCSHGAGRKYSRKQAVKNHNMEEFKKDMGDIVGSIDERRLDECPRAYKDINEVLEYQKDILGIVRHIKPVINLKG